MAVASLVLESSNFNLVHSFVLPTMIQAPRDLSEEETVRLISVIKSEHEPPKTPEEAASLQIHIMEALTVKTLVFMGWVQVGNGTPVRNLFEDEYQAWDGVFDLLLSFEPELRKWEYAN
jgi:hypothetical protein